VPSVGQIARGHSWKARREIGLDWTDAAWKTTPSDTLVPPCAYLLITLVKSYDCRFGSSVFV
jgi:hypothetical protein